MYSIIGLVSSVFLFLPILLIIVLRLGAHRAFPALVVYYASALFYNFLTEGYINANADQIRFIGIMNNLVDIPLTLIFLTYFSRSRLFTKRLWRAILGYVLFELIVVLFAGFSTKAITITIGPGIALVCGISLHYFLRYIKIAIEKNKTIGKAIMITSVLFAYGCFSFLYLLYYIFKAHLDKAGHVNPQTQADTFLVYFMATIFSSIIMCFGIYHESKRVKKLNELKVTRKELSTIYTNTKSTSPYKPVMLDFDRDLWN